MLRTVALLAAALMLGTAATAHAADLIEVPYDGAVEVDDTGWYLSVFGGATWPDAASFTFVETDIVNPIYLDMGWTGGVTAGANLMDFMRAELELSHTSQTFETINEDPAEGTLSATYLLGNVWLQLPTDLGFTPYAGGGVGGAYVALDDFSGYLTNDVGVFDGFGLAYQLGAGVLIDVADNISIDLGYRYKGVVDAVVENDAGNVAEETVIDLSQHVVQVGVNFGF